MKDLRNALSDCAGAVGGDGCDCDRYLGKADLHRNENVQQKPEDIHVDFSKL